MGRPSKPLPPRRPNPISRMKPVREPTKSAAMAPPRGPLAQRACPNKECTAPKIEDGICHNCGTILDDSNIVSEVQFGENSTGAAVVVGSFIGEDQGAARSMGPAFRRAGGGTEDRESTIREGKRIMQSLANQLNVPESVVNSGVQIFKLAAMNNFIQGRRTEHVAAVCLYSACRKERPCRVMLIDFADKVQVNVFKLGHTFKALHSAITLAKDGIRPVLPEDLIYRFASKLEFGLMTSKVAEDAVRMVQRMSLDWMVMGRRPSGVCGACLILAARMNNFRRTITEVVYIVKVTTHTIQKRLDEFKLTASSALTVEEFLNNEFLESRHDPPSFYRKSEEFLKTQKTRKRKRATDVEDGETEETVDENGTNEDHPDQSPQTGDPQPSQSPELSTTPEARIDADGFAIPALPSPKEIPIDPGLVDDAIEDQSGTSFDKLVAQFGDADNNDGEDDVALLDAATQNGRRGRNVGPQFELDEDWIEKEKEIEDTISEIINDPNSERHAIEFAKVEKRVALNMLLEEAENPKKLVNMDVHIGEDEFADDPEVLNCVLPPEEVLKKEKLWVNENKSWLRKQQQKIYAKKMAEAGPPKAKRNRKKKPRIGEGQTSAASTPAEAAVNALKERSWSKRINYEAIRGMFEESGLGSAATSRVTSRAGSTIAGSVADSDAQSVASESVADEAESSPAESDIDVDNTITDDFDNDGYDDDGMD
ncbi:hypothetical protein B7463_g2610, partial [Scytalidium lignicola]